MSEPTVGSLFSGIGGLDLGLERAGFQVQWQSEIDGYCSRVLKKHWPDVPNLGDVTSIDWSDVERVDLICGGYPCQPFSFAGNRAGELDGRNLWPFMRDAIRDLRPRYVLIENVPGHLSLGFDRVLADLASLGFDAEWSVVGACAVGAPHSRQRLFCVAYPAGDDEQGEVSHHPFADRGYSDWQGQPRGSRGTARSDWWLSESTLDRVAHGVPSRLVREPLAALGNAVVPQVAQFIGEQLISAMTNAGLRAEAEAVPQETQ